MKKVRRKKSPAVKITEKDISRIVNAICNVEITIRPQKNLAEFYRQVLPRY